MQEKCCLVCGKAKAGDKGFRRDWCGMCYQAGLKDGSIKRQNRPGRMSLAQMAAFILAESTKAENGCLNSPRPKGRDGYPRIKWNMKQRHCFHIPWLHEHGDKPGGVHFHHRCENKQCVNPAHIEAIDPFVHNSMHHMKFTDEEMRNVRSLWETGAYSYKSLAEELGMSKSQVWGFLNGDRRQAV